MKCWISNSFHRESQFRLPRPPYARSSSSISDPLTCLCSGKTGLAQSQVGWSLGTPWCMPPSLPPGVLQSQIPAPFLDLLWWVLSFFEVSGFSVTWGDYQWESFWPVPVHSFPPPHSSILSWFSFCSIFWHLSLFYNRPSTFIIKKMWHLFDIMKYMKYYTYNSF